MPETRDWQEDWKYVAARSLINIPIHTMHGKLESDIERLTYWMQEYKKKSELYDELKEQLARINCDYHSLKTKFLNMREECGAEKKRADEAENHLRILKKSLTSWQEYYIAEGCKTELDLTKDILKIIEMLEVIGVE